MELQFAQAEKLELLCKVRVSEQFHGFENTPEASRRDHVGHGTIMTGHRYEHSSLSGINGRCGLSLEVLNAVCIFHGKKVYLLGFAVNSASGPNIHNVAQVTTARQLTAGRDDDFNA
jgi:hypothetical protein